MGDIDEKLLNMELQVHIVGYVGTIQAVWPHMIAQGGGTIVNTTSGFGGSGPGLTAYMAAKSGVFSVTRDVAHLDAFAEVCRLHREVVGSPSSMAAAAGGALGAVRTYPFSRDAPAAARHFAVATVGHWGARAASEGEFPPRRAVRSGETCIGLPFTSSALFVTKTVYVCPGASGIP